MTIKYFTPEGLEKLKKDLHKLRTKDRIEISRQIAEARDKGDLSENAEYDAAKEAQGMLEMKIAALETELANARLIDESKIDSSKVMILSKVRLKNLNINKELEYMLVSEKEADLKLGKIAISTPIAQGILGHTVGDVVEIAGPSGKLRLEILSIGR